MNRSLTIKVAVVDDEEVFRKTLTEYLERFREEYGQKIEIHVFSDGMDLISDYTADYDIIFMDVKMTHMDGLETAKRLRELDEFVCLIFITNLAQYAIRGYEYRASDYLIKPMEYDFFKEKFIKLVRSCEKYKEVTLNLVSDQGMTKIEYRDILYIESEKHYVFFYTTKGVFRKRATLREIEDIFLRNDFAYCSNSCLVNLAHVTGFSASELRIGDKILTTSRRKRKEFLNSLTIYLGGRTV